MTQVDFYTHVSDKLRTACLLVGKAYARGLRVLVLCVDAAEAQRLDRMLWSTPATGFVPHCGPHEALAPVTPVIVGCEAAAPAQAQVLLNLRPECPESLERYARVIEIVSLDDEDRARARARFRAYRERGCEIRTHDLSRSREP